MALYSVAIAYASDFPAIPGDITVTDREIIRCSIPGEEHTLYIVMYDLEDGGAIEIFSGIRLLEGWYWESVCLWRPADANGVPVVFEPSGVISAEQAGNSVMITWVEDLDVPSCLKLVYDLERGSFQEVRTP